VPEGRDFVVTAFIYRFLSGVLRRADGEVALIVIKDTPEGCYKQPK
jgi:hypothetical protein